MNQLSSSTVRLISSSQVITTVSSVVKELLENSLDAGSTSVEVKLEGWGLDKIDVRDNGSGINSENTPYMAQRHYTSKINCHGDLDKLTTYGFRGETLASLCAVSSVSITTKTASSSVGKCYTLDENGKISATKPTATATGTTVTASNLFKNLPVRRRFSSKKCKEELKKVEDLLMAYGLVHPAMRLVLRHNKNIVWQKIKVHDYRTALLTTFGTSLLSQLEEVEFQSSNSELEIVGYLPKPSSDSNISSRAVNDRCFTFVNNRPVTLKPVTQLIKNYYNNTIQGTGASRYPFVFLSIKIPPSGLDVNLDPNKYTVLLKDKEEILAVMSDLLEEFYSNSNNVRENSVIAINTEMTIKPRGCADAEEDAVKHMPHQELCPGILTVLDNGSADGVCTGQNLDASDCNGTSLIAREDSSNSLGKEEMVITDAAYCFGNKCISDGSSSHIVPHLHTGITQCSVAEQNLRNTGKAHGKNSHVDSSRLVGLHSVESDDLELSPDLHNTESKQLPTSDQSLHQEYNILLSPSDSTPEENKFCSTVVHSRGTCGPVNPEQRADSHGSIVERAAASTNDQDHPSDLLMDSELLLFSSSSSENELEHSTHKVKHTVSMIATDRTLTSDPENLLNDTSELDLLLCESTTNGDNIACSDKETMENTNGGHEGPLSEKSWSMGRGLIDKEGKDVEPVKLLTLSTHYYNQTGKGTPSLPGKRKHSSNKGCSRLSLAKKKLKKDPRIMNQAMVTTHLSPTPKQRKLLSMKKDVQFSLEKLTQLHQGNGKGKSGSVCPEDREEFHLIGRLDPWGVWIIRKDNEVICLNQYRLQEQLLFQRLMSCHTLPREELERAIVLNERIVGGPDCWRILCDMKSECTPPDPTRYFTDERLTANGFELRQRTDPSSGEIKTEVSAICTSLPFYGVPDLAEILAGLVRESAEDSRALLANSRPLKVVNYLKSEAVRIARGLSSRMTRSDVIEILSHMEEYLTEDNNTCLHNRPFFQKIADVPEHS